MASLFQIFYVSRATASFDHASIESILRGSRGRNAGLQVTGCLLYSGHCFAQVLEGPQAAVRQLARTIAADPRHSAVRFLAESHRDERDYADWTMGYLHDVTLEDDLETLLVIPDRSRAVAADVMERMRPDPVMGALR